MWLIDELAEARIAEAMQRGEFDNLPGRGEPLPPDRNAWVPEELRAAYRLLKNAGFVPTEVLLRREIHAVEQLLATIEDVPERTAAVKRLNLLQVRLAAVRGHQRALPGEYLGKLSHRLGR